MNSLQLADNAVPDLREISLEQIVALGDSVLAHSLSLYSERRGEQSTSRAFNSSI